MYRFDASAPRGLPERRSRGEPMPTDQELLQAYATANLTQALGEHFTLGELVRSDKAIEFHILNFPADGRQPLVTGLQVVQNLALLTKNVLDKIRAQFGDTRINSGYRCAELNK